MEKLTFMFGSAAADRAFGVAVIGGLCIIFWLGVTLHFIGTWWARRRTERKAFRSYCELRTVDKVLDEWFDAELTEQHPDIRDFALRCPRRRRDLFIYAVGAARRALTLKAYYDSKDERLGRIVAQIEGVEG